MLKQLRRPTTTEAQPSDEIAVNNDVLPIPTYPTAFGVFSFPELYERSRKYAAFVLHYRFHMQPDDMEDGLQAGAINLWEHLQQEPHSLQDKTMAWVGLKVVYAALHATRSDWKYRTQTQGEGGEESHSGWGKHSHEARQADKRTDIHRAIASVAERILREEQGKQQQYDLWALYGLTMLQVGAGELSRLFGCASSRLRQAFGLVTLASAKEQLSSITRSQCRLPTVSPVGGSNLKN